MKDTSNSYSTEERLTESDWQPESPFSSYPAFLTESPTGLSVGQSPASSEIESPFVTEYQLEGGEPGPTPQMEMFASLLSELYDREFEEAVTDLVHEASALVEERFSFEAGDVAQQRMEAEQGLRDYFNPLERESRAMLDRMITGLGETDLSTMTETELETFLDQFAPTESPLPPSFSNFVSKLFKKAKKAVNAVRKGVKAVKGVVEKISPIHIVLNKLKGLIKPLLQRVLKSAINRLPVSLRPLARKIAIHFTGVAAETEAAEAIDTGEATAINPSTIQEELDALLAGYLVEGEAFERDPDVMQFLSELGEGPSDQIGELDRARADFARNIVNLREGEDPTPVVERFIPAILAAARIAIKLTGRPRVVNFLAKLVAKLIAKYVGQQQALVLARALVDTGLKLVSLETAAEAESMAAGYTLASTVEETLNTVVAAAPDTAWESEALLEAYVHEAFEKAAAASFPDSHIRVDLRESAEVTGAWVLMPIQGKRKRYKKYTRVLDATVTPQVAKAVTTFGGTPLACVFRDQLGLPPNANVTARVHMYEAIPGTTLSLIAFHEKGVPGLGHARREAWSMIHPLTPEVAGVLFKEPSLGRKVPDRFLVNRNLIEVRQRFYYLEIPGARVRSAPGTPPSGVSTQTVVPQVTQTGLVFDFPRGQLQIFLYYSEADSQNLARHLRKRALASVLLTALKAGLEVRLSTILSGSQTKDLRVVHGAVPMEQQIPPQVIRIVKIVGPWLIKLLLKWALDSLKQELEQRYEQFVSEFTRAAEADADGVTLILVYQQPSFFEQMRRMLGTGALLGAPALAALFGLKQAMSDFKMQIRPGFVPW